MIVILVERDLLNDMDIIIALSCTDEQESKLEFWGMIESSSKRKKEGGPTAVERSPPLNISAISVTYCTLFSPINKSAPNSWSVTKRRAFIWRCHHVTTIDLSIKGSWELQRVSLPQRRISAFLSRLRPWCRAVLCQKGNATNWSGLNWTHVRFYIESTILCDSSSSN